MAEHSIGKITQIIGAVLDIKFTEGHQVCRRKSS